MKINMQKVKRLVVLCWVLLLLVGVGVMPALAAEYTQATAYLFNDDLTVDVDILGAAKLFNVSVDFSVRGTTKRYYDMQLVNNGTDDNSDSQYVLMYGGIRVYVWNRGSKTDGYWIDPAYQEIRFAVEVTDSELIAFLDDNGVVDTNVTIEGPAIDPGDLVPDEIAGTYFQKLVSVINIFWSSPVILSYVGILASLMIVSFIIFGSKR